MTVNLAHVRAKATRLKRVTVTNVGTGQVHVLMDEFALSAKGRVNRLEHARRNDGKDVTSFSIAPLEAGHPAADPVFTPAQAEYVIRSIASVDYVVQERAEGGKGGLRKAGRRDTDRVDVLASTRITLRAAPPARDLRMQRVTLCSIALFPCALLPVFHF